MYVLIGMNPEELKSLDVSKVRRISIKDFKDSLKKVRPSVSPTILRTLETWNKNYGDVST